MGAIKVADGACVLRQDGGVIPNLPSLFAAGYGYASGVGLLSALGCGRLAGLTAAREIAAAT